VGYDLYLWPAERPFTWAEADVEIERRDGGWRLGLGHDKRLDPFLDALRGRYPGIGRDPGGPPVELDVRRRHVVMDIAWSAVEDLVPVVCELAHATGLAVVDPQREVVGLPAPLADGPLGPEGLDDHVRTAEAVARPVVAEAATGALPADEAPADEAPADEAPADEAAPRAISEQLRTIGASMMSPLGFEITPEIEAEVIANPDRVPASLQTPDWRDELLADLAGSSVPDRHRALMTLGGWAPDEAVARSLRRLLASDDIAEAGLAATALARQGDITDLPALLDLLHRCSPDDGGTTEAMLLPLQAALDLAAPEGPEIVAGVKDRARRWRGMPRARRRTTWDGEADAALDALLG
jgi:hypothetical protein